MKTTLTILIIGRNDVGHLARSLRTAGEQAKGRAASVLYVDDCSTDGSELLASKIAEEFDNMEIIRTPRNVHIGGARNFGVSHLQAKGDNCPEYVWLHDSDDYLAPNAVERVLEVIEKHKHPDCVSVPVYTKRPGQPETAPCPVAAKDIYSAAFGPVGEWAQVFKTSLYVQNPEGQMCEDCPWHFEQFDKFETWAKVEGGDPCYVWDNTNPTAITRTVDWCNANNVTLIGAALGNALMKAGVRDRWISDNLRNIANMYDVRHKLTRQWVRDAWAARFRAEVQNMMTGFHVH